MSFTGLRTILQQESANVLRGLAESEDGIHMKRRKTPVMYPDKDNMKEYE